MRGKSTKNPQLKPGRKKEKNYKSIRYESMEYKVKWFLPLSDTKKYEMLMGFLEFFNEAQRSNKQNGYHRKAHRNIQGAKQK